MVIRVLVATHEQKSKAVLKGSEKEIRNILLGTRRKPALVLQWHKKLR